MLRLPLVIVAVASITLASCSSVFWIRSSGAIDTGIRFDFFDDPDRSVEAKLRVTEISLVKIDRNGAESAQWKLAGEARLSGIEYGDVPIGFSELIPEYPLDADSVYLIEVQEAPFGIANALFRFSATGKLAECRRLPECWPAG
jgi:hypothetical protein